MGKKSWYVYLIRANNDALYCGISTDVAKRIEVHQRGQGAKYLVGKLPLRLVYQAEAGDRSSASKIEYCIKQLKKAKKRGWSLTNLRILSPILSTFVLVTESRQLHLPQGYNLVTRRYCRLSNSVE